MPEALFDSIASVYDDTRSLPPEIMGPLIDRLAEMYGAGSRLLEIGVGTGRFSVPLCKKGIDVTGIDLSTGMLTLCRQKGHGKIIKGNACQMPFRDAEFDNAFMTHVLHLVEDWPCLLKEACRVTKGNLATVISHWPGDDWPLRYYSERMKELGFKPHAGIHERVLAERLPPDFEHEIGIIRRERINDDFIRILESRQYSIAKKMPEDLHLQVIAEVKERYGGTVQLVEGKVIIAGWKMGTLSQFLLNVE